MLLVQNTIRNARIYKDRPATIMGDRTRSWSEFNDRVARAAAGLQAIGVAEGDRVGLLALNSDRYLESLFAIMWSGAVMVPMNTRWSLEENLYSVRDSGLEVLIVDDSFLDIAAGVSKGLSVDTGVSLSLIHLSDADAASGMESWDNLVESHDPVAAANRSHSSLAGIYYTGGTTGFPKGVMISHLALWSSAMSSLVEVDGDENTVYLHAAPMFHMADTAFSNFTTIAGGTHTFLSAFTPAGVVEVIEQQRVTIALLVPTMITMLVNDPAFEGADVSSVKSLLYGASPMTAPALKQAMEKLPRVAFIQAYGQTEMAPLITLLPFANHVLEGPDSKLRSAGRPVTSVQVRIVDEQGHDCPLGEPGEIWARGPNAMDGYWNNPEQTAQAMVDGWVKTGDVAYEDEDGFLFICDRAKDMIVSGGENVFSAEVENAIQSHAKVHQVVVIGVPDDFYGERVHALIIPAEGAGEISQQEIYDHCHELIAGYKCPRSIDIRHEPFPLSGAGKILKKDLRAPYWEGREHGVC